MRLRKVISGGQTGVDQAGLRVAQSFGYETGGHCPANYKTENGPAPSLLKSFGLVPTPSGGYNIRTQLNAENSDGTVLFGETSSPGSILTIHFCEKAGKPYIVNPTSEELLRWLDEKDIEVLNVAGNRLSKSVGAMNLATAVLTQAFEVLKGGESCR